MCAHDAFITRMPHVPSSSRERLTSASCSEGGKRTRQETQSVVCFPLQRTDAMASDPIIHSDEARTRHSFGDGTQQRARITCLLFQVATAPHKQLPHAPANSKCERPRRCPLRQFIYLVRTKAIVIWTFRLGTPSLNMFPGATSKHRCPVHASTASLTKCLNA